MTIGHTLDRPCLDLSGAGRLLEQTVENLRVAKKELAAAKFAFNTRYYDVNGHGIGSMLRSGSLGIGMELADNPRYRAKLFILLGELPGDKRKAELSLRMAFRNKGGDPWWWDDAIYMMRYWKEYSLVAKFEERVRSLEWQYRERMKRIDGFKR